MKMLSGSASRSYLYPLFLGPGSSGVRTCNLRRYHVVRSPCSMQPSGAVWARAAGGAPLPRSQMSQGSSIMTRGHTISHGQTTGIISGLGGRAGYGGVWPSLDGAIRHTRVVNGESQQRHPGESLPAANNFCLNNHGRLETAQGRRPPFFKGVFDRANHRPPVPLAHGTFHHSGL
jgi:hypothetical protein